MTQTIIDILILFVAFFWQAYMQALIITQLFNIETTRTKNIIFSLILTIYSVYAKLAIPLSLSFLNSVFSLILLTLLFKFVYSRGIKESVVSTLIIFLVSIPTEMVSSALLFNLFKFDTNVENIVGMIPILTMANIWFTVIALVIYNLRKAFNHRSKPVLKEDVKTNTSTNVETKANTESDDKTDIKADTKTDTITENSNCNKTEVAQTITSKEVEHKTENEKEIENTNKATPFKSSMYINIILVACIISPNIMFYTSNKYDYPLYLLIFNIVANILLVVLSIYDTYKCVQLERKKEALRISELHNKTLTDLLDGIRTFKHDHANTIHAISGYLAFNDIDGLKKYFAALDHDTKKSAQLESISPTKISEPSIYTLIATKYDVASKKDIFFRVETMYDYKKLAMPIYDFTKILGVLIDNAIEAAEECEIKEINISFRRITTEQLQIFTIENTYKNKAVDTEKIFEKHYSTKNRNSGIGLWEVKNIVDRNVNANLVTSKDEKYFTQRLFISEILLDD